MTLFPIQNYNQSISDWIPPTSAHYNTPVLTPEQQQLRLTEWKSHYFGRLSPWNKTHLEKIFSYHAPSDIKTFEENKLRYFSNENKSAKKISYGLNFRPYTSQWILKLKNNIHLSQFNQLKYTALRRAIAVDNLIGRELPTDDVHFYNPLLAGEGFPFDNLQASIIWAGTPIYILGETRDHRWALVLTPSFTAWVKNIGLARVDESFIQTWTVAAEKQLIAITKTEIPIDDNTDHLNRFTGYIGMAFPGALFRDHYQILIPVSDSHGKAVIFHADLSRRQGALMPLTPTPHQLVKLMKNLIGRPYGWGGLYFYNDCALELKSLFTPFGIWLPTSSHNQINKKLYRLTVVDLSKKSAKERLQYLMRDGHPFMTLVHVEGHIFLYLGNYSIPGDPQKTVVALSYQDVWGLKLKHPTPSTDRRSIIGGSVIFPILLEYPEDTSLISFLDKKQFQLGYLDEPEKSPLQFPT